MFWLHGKHYGFFKFALEHCWVSAVNVTGFGCTQLLGMAPGVGSSSCHIISSCHMGSWFKLHAALGMALSVALGIGSSMIGNSCHLRFWFRLHTALGVALGVVLGVVLGVALDAMGGIFHIVTGCGSGCCSCVVGSVCYIVSSFHLFFSPLLHTPLSVVSRPWFTCHLSGIQ